MGELRYLDKKRFIEFLDKGNVDTFYKVLFFYQQLILEWVEAGIQAKEFAEKGAKIAIILDHGARFPTKKEYIEKIAAEMPNIHLEFLPEYSPDYNLIELVWHSTKEYIANRLFQSIE